MLVSPGYQAKARFEHVMDGGGEGGEVMEAVRERRMRDVKRELEGND